MRSAPSATRAEVIADAVALACAQRLEAPVRGADADGGPDDESGNSDALLTGPALSAFVEHYLAGVPTVDLVARAPAELLARARHHLDVGRCRRPGEMALALTPRDDGFAVVDVVTDDMPFLLDSLTAALYGQGCAIHLVVHPIFTARRDGDGDLLALTPRGMPAAGTPEAWMHVEIDRHDDLGALREGLVRVLGDVRVAVADWEPMRRRALDLADDISARLVPSGPEEAAEVAALLRWLADGHFIFLGARDDDLTNGEAGATERPVAGTGLGVLGPDHPGHERHLPPTPDHGVVRRLAERRLFRATTVGARSTVLRPDEITCLAFGRFDPAGELVGEHRLLGLLTAAAYRTDAEEVPVVRRKIATVIDRAGYPLHSHSGRELRTILGTYPRDELFQADVDVLDVIARGVLDLQEREQVRLFPREDPDGRFVSCLVYLPRERYSTGVVERIEAVLLAAYAGTDAEHDAYLSESVLARLHVVVRLAQGAPSLADATHALTPTVAEIEPQLAAVTRWWIDDVRDALVAAVGESKGRAWARQYGEAMPAGYREANDAAAAVGDITRLATLDPAAGFATALYRPPDHAPGEMRLKLYSLGEPVTLTRVLPLLEHMGVQVVDERPFAVRPAAGPPAWIYDIGLRLAPSAVIERGEPFDNEDRRRQFEAVFGAAWRGEIESDGLNRLVLRAGLRGDQVQLVRAYTRYLRQIGTTFSPAYVEDTLAAHPDVVRGLVELFERRLDPARQASVAELAWPRAELAEKLDGVASLDEDRILRSLLHLVEATTRTNVYRPDRGRGAAPTTVFKFDPGLVPDLPLPRPRFEIWVHSAAVEGVHLRGGPIARGGLRWSDRREDVRTEVLGLMKAQMVKNAVIVPVGAKGGFVVRRPPTDADALRGEVRSCYRSFVAGLLDVTDNLEGGAVVSPPGVVRHDADDPYLVVAADKGTATFSDLANEVAGQYGFWLGDAFASGGSAGYDHKAMGITARGAWCSVQRHFRTLGVDVDTTPITVAGIGDMSGDVFGNGVLLSRHLRLVAAFDHRHVFIDPDPDPARSYAERRRLFELPRSSWADYDRTLLSDGGGVWPRAAKSIPLSGPVRAALAIDAEQLTPAALISAILCAPVDLLWNGGIGTYVKASTERHAEVGDRANDAVRVDAADLRCRVVGEGGNLGFTQLGRVEYARAGGLVDTDAIDNSAGVDCSDHEVNIKIALDAAVAAGRLAPEGRNPLLATMTDEVAELVLDDNREQTLALTMARAQATSLIDVHARQIRALEADGHLNREIEALPGDKALAERQAAGEGLTAPEFAVLLAYAKTTAVTEAVASDLPDDPWLDPVLANYFPRAVRDGYPDAVRHHRLRREIVATRVVNDTVNAAGTSFLYRMTSETGATVPDVLRAHLVASAVYARSGLEAAVEAEHDRIDSASEIAVLLDLRRLVERAALWLLRHRRPPLDLGATVAAFAPGIEELASRLFTLVPGAEGEVVQERAAGHGTAGLSVELAQRAAVWPLLHLGLDMVEVAQARGRTVLDGAATELGVIDVLGLSWLSARIGALPRADQWQSQARAGLRDDLQAELRELTAEVLRGGDASSAPDALVELWVEHNGRAVERLRAVHEEIRSSATFTFTTLSVALRQLRNLLLTSQPAV